MEQMRNVGLSVEASPHGLSTVDNQWNGLNFLADICVQQNPLGQEQAISNELPLHSLTGKSPFVKEVKVKSPLLAKKQIRGYPSVANIKIPNLLVAGRYKSPAAILARRSARLEQYTIISNTQEGVQHVTTVTTGNEQSGQDSIPQVICHSPPTEVAVPVSDVSDENQSDRKHFKHYMNVRTLVEPTSKPDKTVPQRSVRSSDRASLSQIASNTGQPSIKPMIEQSRTVVVVLNRLSTPIDFNVGKLSSTVDLKSESERTSKSAGRSVTQAASYECGICTAKFTDICDYREHEKSHESTVQRKIPGLPYVCLPCGRRFRSEAQLMDHVTLHASNEPYACENCGRTFCSYNLFKDHERMHFEYQCPSCLERFGTSSLLDEHSQSCPARVQATVGKDTENTEVPADEGGRRESGDGKLSLMFKCPKCSVSYKRAKSLWNHEILKHNNKRKSAAQRSMRRAILKKPEKNKIIKVTPGAP
ncbi:PREDICTED: zinc finger protein 62 homolog, partial [Priapulus caudatus]|uniref:Zinc finger protein 62 homolog n=1 Tax=Priapulus caudatus TaxID=37621 RepID=A0ABM1EXY0_PRICU